MSKPNYDREIKEIFKNPYKDVENEVVQKVIKLCNDGYELGLSWQQKTKAINPLIEEIMSLSGEDYRVIFELFDEYYEAGLMDGGVDKWNMVILLLHYYII